ncbi:dienelactone hydrolase family protein [Alicyclobacillus acidoterrestris]|uniref:Dienelactone hydrolase family protein n=1 Tax=Alicyclobacillus acidoterrestris (strain ATCC 49025 / DSM 3922 / CIP 106132 / NCIMB 13137 / GD3B) TaxID=1356854 RepID=A0A9E7CVX5_ALIAG|nr:dienelactone hydrolase family protein [Alicyclobacillus acidoterrestris]UNO48818.1 dienelactone hydrolase family protein [Alicyclobacillus acidoterrestris]
MSLHTEWIRYGSEQVYSGYLAKPERAADGQPAVVVLQEIWGVDDHIQDVTRRFAQAGYVAFAPDLYAEHGARRPGLDVPSVEAVKRFLNEVSPAVWHDASAREAALSKLPEPDQTTIRTTFGTLFGGLNLDAYGDQLISTTDFLRNHYSTTSGQPIVSVGFCMGGALSAILAATDEKLAGAAIFYGRAPSEEQIANIACPVRGFYGALDDGITSQVPGFAEKMKENGKSFSYKVYENAHHAFFNDTRASYNPRAVRAAFAEVLSFFDEVTR